MELLTVGAVAAAILIIVAVVSLAPKAGVAAPLVLVLIGVGVGFLPWVPRVVVGPQWILLGVLPALLYSTSVALPAMDFRRDLGSIVSLAGVLVVISSLAMGWVFTLLLPGINFATGVALGAVISPTDAVATSIVRRLGVASRVITVLEGESLLNDASALVLLRSAIAASGAGMSVLSVTWHIAYAVVVAVGVGIPVGFAGLYLRSKLGQPALSTAVSFATPFVAYLPAEVAHASGLVSVVVAGMITGHGAARYLRPQDRQSEQSNWATVELLLEGAVFALMGLHMAGLVDDVRADGGSLRYTALVVVAALVGVLAIRAVFVAVLVPTLRARARRIAQARDYLAGVQRRLEARVIPPEYRGESRHRRTRRAHRMHLVLQRRIADIDYQNAQKFGPRKGAVLIWGGMRGVVTLAAAQSLPASTPGRHLVLLVAFGVAVASLLIQGGTLPWVVRRLGLASREPDDAQDLVLLQAQLDTVAAAAFDAPDLRQMDGSQYDPAVVARARRDMVRGHRSHTADLHTTADRFRQYRQLRLAVIAAQRAVLLEARSWGVYSSQALCDALDILDAEQIDVETRHGGQSLT